ncbi:MAG: hypothetical protein LBC53_04115 [Spirochaetaceae bacterium]|nr:hypothetical protein [Spirochaetaceae bacterium]
MIFSGKLAAQETIQTNDNLAFYYDAELFQWNYGFFEGLTLNFKNQSSNPMFGINTRMKNALVQYEDSNQQYRVYHGKNIAGNILMWSGFTATVTGMYMPLFLDLDYSEKNLKIVLGTVLGGFVTELVGIVILHSGNENIFNAVNVYNRNKIKDYRLRKM